jgi:hypothetical protein
MSAMLETKTRRKSHYPWTKDRGQITATTIHNARSLQSPRIKFPRLVQLREYRLGGLSMAAIALWVPNPRCCKALLSNDV